MSLGGRLVVAHSSREAAAEGRGARLWAAMVEQGIGYSELGLRSGLDRRTIYRIPRGEKLRPWASTIEALARLGVDTLWLMNG